MGVDGVNKVNRKKGWNCSGTNKVTLSNLRYLHKQILPEEDRGNVYVFRNAFLLLLETKSVERMVATTRIDLENRLADPRGSALYWEAGSGSAVK